MLKPHGGATDIWADGVNPAKSEIRDWGGAVESAFDDMQSQITSGLLAASDWADLLTLAGSQDGAGAEVPASDGGTHLDATATGYDGDVVGNAGRYRWQESWSRWQWVSALGVVENTDLDDVAEGTFKGRLSAGSGSPEDLTLDQAREGLGVNRDRANRLINDRSGVGETSALLGRLAAVESEMAVLRAGKAAVYADTTATGAGDGSSWADAYTDLEVALEAVGAGGVVMTNAPESAPFRPCTASIASAVTWVSDAGNDGVTWISGAEHAASPGQAGAWNDEGAGVFSIVPVGVPTFVAFDFRRDDVSGTVTGVDLTEEKFAAALKRWGRDSADCVAWYGFLDEEAVATASPSEGCWSVSGGVLYIHPASSPSLASVNDLAIWAEDGLPAAVNLVPLSGKCEPFYHKGNLVTYFTPAESGGNGYGVRNRYSQYTCVEDVTSVASGYHSVGLAGESLDHNTIRNCLTVGGCGSGNPYVFYTDAGDLPNSGHLGDGLIYVSAPYLKQDGTPLRSDYSGQSQVGYSHTAGGFVLGGITYSRCLGIDPSFQIAAHHGFTLPAVPVGRMVGARDVPAGIDQESEATFPVRAVDCLGLGPSFGPEVQVSHDFCEFDAMGNAAFGFSFFTSPRSWFVRLSGCKWSVTCEGTDGTYFTQVEDGYGSISIVDSEVRIENAGTQGFVVFTEPPAAGLLTVERSRFSHSQSGGALVTAVNSMSAAEFVAAEVIKSKGGNAFAGDMYGVRSSSGAEQLSAAELIDAVDATGSDVFGV